MRYVILLDNAVTVGPFATKADAELYRATDLEKRSMRVLELDSPARNWKNLALKREQPPSSYHFTLSEAQALCADNRDYQLVGAGGNWFKIWCGTSAHYVER